MSKKVKVASFGNTKISTEGVDATQVNVGKTETENFIGGNTFLSGVPFGNHNGNPAEDLFIPSTVVSPVGKIPGYQKFVYIVNQLSRLRSYYVKFTKIAELVQRFQGSAADYQEIAYKDRDKVYKKMLGGE